MAADDIKILCLKIDQLTEIQKNSNEKISDIRERLFEPDEGIYARIHDITSLAEKHEQTDLARHEELKNWTTSHEQKDIELRDTVHTLASSMHPLVKDFEQRNSRKKWRDKIVWAILAGIIAILVPTVCKSLITSDKIVNEDL